MLIALKIGKSFEYMGLETDRRGILSAIHESMIYGSRVGLFPELNYTLPWHTWPQKPDYLSHLAGWVPSSQSNR
jgi:hypothetical protein